MLDYSVTKLSNVWLDGSFFFEFWVVVRTLGPSNIFFLVLDHMENKVCIAGHSKNHHQVKQYCLRLVCCMMKPWHQICFYMLPRTVNVHSTHFSSICQTPSTIAPWPLSIIIFLDHGNEVVRIYWVKFCVVLSSNMILFGFI